MKLRYGQAWDSQEFLAILPPEQDVVDRTQERETFDLCCRTTRHAEKWLVEALGSWTVARYCQWLTLSMIRSAGSWWESLPRLVVVEVDASF